MKNVDNTKILVPSINTEYLKPDGELIVSSTNGIYSMKDNCNKLIYKIENHTDDTWEYIISSNKTSNSLIQKNTLIKTGEYDKFIPKDKPAVFLQGINQVFKLIWDNLFSLEEIFKNEKSGRIHIPFRNKFGKSYVALIFKYPNSILAHIHKLEYPTFFNPDDHYHVVLLLQKTNL